MVCFADNFLISMKKLDKGELMKFQIKVRYMADMVWVETGGTKLFFSMMLGISNRENQGVDLVVILS